MSYDNWKTTDTSVELDCCRDEEIEANIENLTEAWGDLTEAQERYQQAYRDLESQGVDLTHVSYTVVIPEEPRI